MKSVALFLWFSTLLAALFSVPALSDDLHMVSSLNSFCADTTRDQLCADYPDDQTDFSEKFVYMFINATTQTPFDVYSWQAFTALNWSETGLRLPEANSDWGQFSRREEVFGNDLAREQCNDLVPDAQVITSALVQSDGNALIDQNGNFIVYEARLNATAESYILGELLNTSSGQAARQGKVIDFPQGRLGEGATPASVLIKTSWQVLPHFADSADYIVRNGLIAVPAEASADGEPMCLRERLGLVGMHIVSRTHSGNGDEWLWSTFEHRRTVPNAGNARKVNSVFARDLFPSGCSAPDTAVVADYIFFDPDCPNCQPNQPPDRGLKWATSQPYAGQTKGDALARSQVVRCWEIFEGTSRLNGLWQAKLTGTPLSNYQLISTQWRGADKSPMFEHGEVPRFVTNTTLETYVQADSEGTCLGCHAGAETSSGGHANFTFLLSNPRNE